MSGFGGVLRGLTTAATGAEQGLANRDELERQARLQLLAQRLQESTINRNNAEATKALTPTTPKQGKYTGKIDPITGKPYYIYEPAPGEAPPDIGDTPPTAQVPGAPPQKPAVVGHPSPKPKPAPKAKPRPIVTYKPDGTAVFLDPTTLQPITPGDQNVGRPANVQQLTAGAQAPIADNAVTHMERVATSDPDAFRTAVAFIRAKRHGRLGDMLSEARGALSDANAQAIVEDYYNYMLNISPTYGGTRPTKVLMDLETEAGVPPIGSDESTWPRIFQRFHDQVKVLRARAGRAAQPDTVPARFQP